MSTEGALACVAAPGKGCEDHGVLGPDVAVVVDGVGLPPGGCRHGVAWYARHLTTAIAAAVADPAVPLVDGLATAIAAVAARHPGCDLGHPATPSAAVGIVRFGADDVQALTLADVTIAVDLGADGVHTVTDPHTRARAGLVGAALGGHRAGTAAHAAAVDTLLAERATACNRPGGLWVAAADPSVAVRATVQSLPRAGVRTVAVCSDGAAWPAEQGVWPWATFFALLAERGPSGLIGRVRDLEHADRDCLAYPRVKRHDDATAAVLRVVS